MSYSKGVIMAGGQGSRLAPLTNVVNKHLLPVYDKPMIYYPLATLMLSGVREIAIIVNPENLESFESLLGNGANFGISIQYFIQDKPLGIPDGLIKTKKWINNSNVALILGDNIFIGPGLGRQLQNDLSIKGATIFGFLVNNPKDYGVVEFDRRNKIISLEEKPIKPKSKYAIPGLYFLDEHASEISESLKLSARGELEIVDLLQYYLKVGDLHLKIMQRGTGWMDCGSVETLFTAGEYVRVVQQRQGLKVLSPEEISFVQGWITEKELVKLSKIQMNTEYSEYLREVYLSYTNQI